MEMKVQTAQMAKKNAVSLAEYLCIAEDVSQRQYIMEINPPIYAPYEVRSTSGVFPRNERLK